MLEAAEADLALEAGFCPGERRASAFPEIWSPSSGRQRRIRCELDAAGSAADFRQANSPHSLLTISFPSHPSYDLEPLTMLMSRFLQKKIR